MRMIGVIGGIAPGSTIEYYRQFIARYREVVTDGSYPPLVINSIDLKQMLDLIGTGKLVEVTDYLVAEMERLARAGADVGLFASNTPHLVFDDVQRRSPIPLISIVGAACDAALEMGMKRVGLFGTRFTMQARFYPDVFAARGITVVAPNEADQTFIHTAYMNELIAGVFRDDTRARLLAIANGMVEREGIDGLVLGGTELPLILTDPAGCRVPMLDTTRIHVERAVAAMLE